MKSTISTIFLGLLMVTTAQAASLDLQNFVGKYELSPNGQDCGQFFEIRLQNKCNGLITSMSDDRNFASHESEVVDFCLGQASEKKKSRERRQTITITRNTRAILKDNQIDLSEIFKEEPSEGMTLSQNTKFSLSGNKLKRSITTRLNGKKMDSSECTYKKQ
ncbi:hypothetical protein [Peredibacter starrii]|uniref:DUF3617 family protein n=1 Tax=Peredibacter starrii TaxID=28202 RepID=A0AAX4HPU9_9BACT|nr:hypothetical protein [Peredibacter starrii]WPU65346.1 hypothetical protein SOO65_01135 [Peredibacter starrii]